MSHLDFIEEGYVHITEDGKYINRNIRNEHGMKQSYEILLVDDVERVNVLKSKMDFHNDELDYSGVNTQRILETSKCIKVRKVTGMFETKLEPLEIV